MTYKRELSGQVTYAESGMPVPGLTIEADCPSGGATATGSDGKYQFLLDKGPCTITPEPPDGEGVSPEKQALDVEGNIDHVDFQVTATLYFKVGQGLSVKSDSGTGAGRQ